MSKHPSWHSVGRTNVGLNLARIIRQFVQRASQKDTYHDAARTLLSTTYVEAELRVIVE